MAAIQIKADIVIIACDKMTDEIEKSYVLRKKNELTEDEMLTAKPLLSALKMIDRIKKLAEYAIQPRHGD